MGLLVILVIIIAVIYFQGLIYRTRLHEKEKRRQKLKIEKFQSFEKKYPIIKTPGNSKLIKPLSYGFYDFKPKSGAHDEYFASELRKIFGDKICTNLRLNNKYPDIILLNNEANFYLDIEIDEVYDMESGSVIHEEGSDDRRNNYFTSRGWYVLRFSEEQIVKQTRNCCKYVAQVYAYYTLDKLPLDNFDDSTQIEFVEQWSKVTGSVMVKENFRSKHLGVRKINKSTFQQPNTHCKDEFDDDLPF